MFRISLVSICTLMTLTINLIILFIAGYLIEKTPDIHEWVIYKWPYSHWLLFMYIQYWSTYYYDEWNKKIL